MKKKQTVRTAVVASAAAATLGVVGVGIAQAAEDDSDSSTSSAAERERTGGPDGSDSGSGHGPGPRMGGSSAELAEALGVSEEKLEAAYTAVREDLKPDAGPESGSEPDSESGERTPPSAEDREARQTALIAALAQELDVSEADVKAAFDEVQTAEKSERRERLESRLDAAVDDRDLTDSDKASVLKAYDAGVLSGKGR